MITPSLGYTAQAHKKFCCLWQGRVTECTPHPQGPQELLEVTPKLQVLQPTHGGLKRAKSSPVGQKVGDSTQDPHHWYRCPYRGNKWNGTLVQIGYRPTKNQTKYSNFGATWA